jgi:alginate O-acetyltransferase complex protein AlgI
MVFSEYLFVFLFLPVFLLVYSVSPRALRNVVLLAASLLFYWIGEGKGLWLLIAVIIGNYTVARLIQRALEQSRNGRARLWVTIGVAGNLCALAWFKYIGFLTANANEIARLLGAEGAIVPVVQVALPLGISFFVFQGISYVVDVYRGDSTATRSLLNFATYKAMFPQLVAGPIVRYADVAKELVVRNPDAGMRFEGMRRFLVGFAKKVLLADTFAWVADAAFAVPHAELSAGLAWTGALAYALQIYFDFSAYSDMAIGIGLIMGFRFPENFNYPYIAGSIKDFWRRWHMTLSRWFRDYVYIPLGGNRKGAARTYANLLLVFFLTGLWHGASWTFVIWGLWHGSFLMLERVTNLDRLRSFPVVRHVYVLGVVLVGWVVFRADDFPYAFGMLKAMAGLGQGTRVAAEFLDPVVWFAAVAGFVFCTPAYGHVRNAIGSRYAMLVGVPLFGAAFVLASAKVLTGAYSPFLYFRF